MASELARVLLTRSQTLSAICLISPIGGMLLLGTAASFSSIHRPGSRNESLGQATACPPAVLSRVILSSAFAPLGRGWRMWHRRSCLSLRAFGPQKPTKVPVGEGPYGPLSGAPRGCCPRAFSTLCFAHSREWLCHVASQVRGSPRGDAIVKNHVGYQTRSAIAFIR